MTICNQCNASFVVENADLALYSKMSPVFEGKKYDIAPPTLCALCRMQRRQAHRNTRNLYHTVSSLSGKPCISMYDPVSGLVVYAQEEWWSDSWDPLRYGQAVNLAIPFFQQLKGLRKSVPRFNVYNRDCENSNYVNYAPHNKNCYLIFGSWFNEDCQYGETLLDCKNCLDGYSLEKCEIGYELVDCDKSYGSSYSQSCSGTTDSLFCFDCRGVSHCIGCWNLRNKEYHVFNKPVSKEEFAALRARFASREFTQKFSEQYRKMKTAQAVHKATTGAQNENCSGDFLFQCKNVKFAFTGYRAEDVRYASRTADQKDSADLEGVAKGEFIYESVSTDFSYACIGCSTCENAENCHYCDLCFNCRDCFGCIGLRRRQYCILNKQYTKEEYDRFVPQIIESMQKNGEWTEYLPVDHSLFAYNETVAYENFPLGKEEVIARGWRWKEADTKQYEPQKHAVADAISDTPDSIVQEILACTDCRKNFRITMQELTFYRRQSIPVPLQCPDCRHKERHYLRNQRALWRRPCMKCGMEMETSYAPDRPEKVYCEDCYLKAVY